MQGKRGLNHHHHHPVPIPLPLEYYYIYIHSAVSQSSVGLRPVPIQPPSIHPPERNSFSIFIPSWLWPRRYSPFTIYSSPSIHASLPVSHPVHPSHLNYILLCVRCGWATFIRCWMDEAIVLSLRQGREIKRKGVTGWITVDIAHKLARGLSTGVSRRLL